MRIYTSNQSSYWNKMESARTKTGKLPGNAFDFISIHNNQWKEGERFSLLSPMMVVERLNGRRPWFENKQFETFESAKSYAKRLATRLRKIGFAVHVVNCCR